MRLREWLSSQRTITNELIIGLIVMLVPIMLVRGTIEYRFVSSNVRASLEKSAEASADDLATILQEPLFVMNHDEVNRIAATYIASGRLAGIRIVSESNGPLVEKPARQASLIAPRERAIRWQGYELGRVTLWFADTDLARARDKLLRTLALLSLGVLGFGIIFITLYLRLSLDRPLAKLRQRIGEMADGQLAGELPPVPQQDLNQIMAATNRMSRELEAASVHLRESNRRYQALVDNIPLGINLIDADYRVVMSNATMGRWFGKTPTSFTGQHCYREFEKRDEVCAHCPGTMAMTTGSMAMAETEGVRDDGSRFAVRIRTVPVGAIEGTTGFIEVVEDITAARRAEEEKIQAEIQLNQAQRMEAIGTLAGGIAHDFNNILTAIIGFTDLARLQIKEDTPLQEHLGQVRKAADRATDLVKQILTFSRQQKQERLPLQIAPVVKEALKLLRASIPTTIEIRQDISSQGLALADPTQIHQVIMNLCTNAYHAMLTKGGVLAVSLTEVVIEHAQPVCDNELPPGQYLKLSVSDSGCGIDREILGKIFEPYFTTKEKGRGTGLGLAVVHGIVKEHQGRISVYSELGRGTTFNVYLPLISQGLTESLPVTSQPPLSRAHERIMVVDDEEPIRAVIQQFLTSAGYRVDLFADGGEAWQALSRNPDAWQLLLTDQTMPGMTGDQLVERVRELRPTLPTIICSGFSELLDEERLRDLGVRAYLQKPLGYSILLETVAEVLRP